MARLGCTCGGEMTNTQGPSQHILNVFFVSEANEAIAYNPQIRLWDFYTGWDEIKDCEHSFQSRNQPVEYWYCTECGRIHEVQRISCGKIIRSYSPQHLEKEPIVDLQNLKELLVLTDIEMDKMLVDYNEMLLSEYVNSPRNVKYYSSIDEKTVYIYENEHWKPLIYQME